MTNPNSNEDTAVPSEAPYSVEPNGDSFLLYNEAGFPVAKIWDDERASFIRQACTSHAALVAKVQELFDYYMGEHACGDFTCACNDRKHCGTCDLRESTREFLALAKPLVRNQE